MYIAWLQLSKGWKFQGVPKGWKFQGVPKGWKFQGVRKGWKFQGVYIFIVSRIFIVHGMYPLYSPHTHVTTELLNINTCQQPEICL